MENNSSNNISSKPKVDKPLTWSEAKKYGNGNLFKNNSPSGSIETWRNRRNVGGAPNRVAMSEVKPLEKNVYSKFCQCSEAIVDAATFSCTICKEHFDAMENKKLESYRVTGV